MSRIDGALGAEKWSTCADRRADDKTPFGPKQVIYQFYSAARAVAYLGCFAAKFEAYEVHGARSSRTLKMVKFA